MRVIINVKDNACGYYVPTISNRTKRKTLSTSFKRVQVLHRHVAWSSTVSWPGMDARGEVWVDMPSESVESFDLSEGPKEDPISLSKSVLLSKDLDPHHKSSCSLLSAAIAAACIGLRAALMLLSPPKRLGPDGKRAPRRALFSAAAKAVCRKDDEGGWWENPPKRLPGRSNPCPVPVIPLAISSSHSCRIAWGQSIRWW